MSPTYGLGGAEPANSYWESWEWICPHSRLVTAALGTTLMAAWRETLNHRHLAQRTIIPKPQALWDIKCLLLSVCTLLYSSDTSDGPWQEAAASAERPVRRLSLTHHQTPQLYLSNQLLNNIKSSLVLFFYLLCFTFFSPKQPLLPRELFCTVLCPTLSAKSGLHGFS